MDQTAERHARPWLLPASPVIWAVHFMASYITAAIWCGKIVGPYGTLGPVRTVIAVYTVIALAGIVLIGYAGLRRHRHGAASLPHDDDSPEDRHRFLGFSTLLLSGLSFVAVCYSALAVAFVEGCQ